MLAGCVYGVAGGTASLSRRKGLCFICPGNTQTKPLLLLLVIPLLLLFPNFGWRRSSETGGTNWGAVLISSRPTSADGCTLLLLLAVHALGSADVCKYFDTARSKCIKKSIHTHTKHAKDMMKKVLNKREKNVYTVIQRCRRRYAPHTHIHVHNNAAV